MSDAAVGLAGRLQRHIALLEAAIDEKTRELERINAELEQRVDARTRELAAALARAEAASAAKQSFLAHMSHELRTPLHAICGMSEVLQAGCDGLQRRRVEVIRAAGGHMLKLVNQLLDLSWLSRDEMPMHLEPTDVAKLVEEAVAACDVPAAGKGLRVRACIDAVPPRLMVDAMRLREVLLNLLGNAVKFTAAGRVTLHVRGAADGDTHVLAWEVEDTGCGMDAATVARMFEPFFQARDTYRREHGGAGLGMAISRRIVQAMGGEVSVHSEPGRGTRVVFSTRHVLAGVDAAGETASATGPAGGVAGRRVLVVDDQEVNCCVAEAVLDQLGCTASTTCDPALAIARATAEPFDLLLVDYHMPGIDGCELVARLRQAGVRTPVLLATADLTAGAHTAAAVAGCDGVLGKPFSGEELRARMAAVLALDVPAPAIGPGASAAVATAAAPAAAPLFAVETALLRLGGKVPVLRAVVGAFLQSLPELLPALVDAAGQGPLRVAEAAARRRCAAHALKGSAATVGAEHLAALAHGIEHGDTPSSDGAELRRVAAATVAAMRAWLSG